MTLETAKMQDESSRGLGLAAHSDGVASALGRALAPRIGETLPFQLVAWDGSRAGPPSGPTVVLRSPHAIRRLIRSPGELGLARAYVSGELDVDGDLATGLAAVWDALRVEGRRLTIGRLARGGGPARFASTLRSAVALGALRAPPPPPRSEARLRGRLHSPRRDRAVIGHHYDLSNAFYELLLDETMAYSCAYWTSDAPGYSLADAQRDKLELVASKVGLVPGSRLLDVGCGWGSLTLHAAIVHGAHVTAVTLSSNQAEHVRRRVAELDLGRRVTVLLADYRAIPPGEYDAVTSIEMGEHVGRSGYPAFARALAAHLRPGGRLLVQQMSRPSDSPGGGPFIETYIAPDMFMRPVGQTVDLLEQAGLEVRDVHAMREHYARTAWAWYSTLEQRAAEAELLVGAEVVRVWRLYLAGIALGFERGRSGVDQILAVRPTRSGASGMAPVRGDHLAPAIRAPGA